MKGLLYCVCNRADEGVCDECKKYQRIHPDHTLNYSSWKRVTEDERRERGIVRSVREGDE